MMIKIFDYELYSGYIMLDGKIVAYSLHNDRDMLIKNLVRISKFHNLNGDLIFDENIDKFFQEKINKVLNNKEKFKLDLSRYRYKDIYEKILEIPFGKTITYKELYNSLNKKYNMLQILNAIKNNPFIILIPCHRIVKEDNISGYTPLGTEFKRKLLEYEHNLLIDYKQSRNNETQYESGSKYCRKFSVDIWIGRESYSDPKQDEIQPQQPTELGVKLARSSLEELINLVANGNISVSVSDDGTTYVTAKKRLILAHWPAYRKGVQSYTVSEKLAKDLINELGKYIPLPRDLKEANNVRVTWGYNSHGYVIGFDIEMEPRTYIFK